MLCNGNSFDFTGKLACTSWWLDRERLPRAPGATSR